jgi:CHAT domain-containing protein
MAGANAAWSGQAKPEHIEDGVATAYEISHLNLSNTKLAVLSACQTGLGDIKGSEGVYGLQRAFKMAGVDYLLVSLWQVPDQETADFMEAFYSAWLGGNTIHAAFAKAQKKMRRKYKQVYQWGAWVLVE